MQVWLRIWFWFWSLFKVSLDQIPVKYLKRCASFKISVKCRHCWAVASMFPLEVIVCVRVHSPCSCCFFCFHLITVELSGCSLVWLVGSCVPQLLTDLSEYVSLTSPAAPALPTTQRQPPKPPPVSTRASAAELVSAQTDQLDRPVRACVASSMSAWSLTGVGNLKGLCKLLRLVKISAISSF